MTANNDDCTDVHDNNDDCTGVQANNDDLLV